MTTGLAATTLANKYLDMLAGTAFTAPPGSFAKLHLGDPGAAGTSNASSVTTRVAMTWLAATGGSKSITTTLPAWATWAGTSPETITHISVWDAITAGNFLYSFPLTTSRTVITGDTLTLASHSHSFTPIAA